MFRASDKKKDGAVAVFGAIGDIDSRYLHEAYLADGPERLAYLKNEEKTKKRCKRSEYGLLYKGIACFACLALIVGVVMFGYIRENRTPANSPVWDGFELIEGEVRIDGIDTLNYYSARRALGYGGESAAVSIMMPIDHITTEKDALVSGDKDADGDIVYYEFDPAWDFTVTKVTYFKAELKEKNGFLATKLGGVGEMDVIITENSIEDMITFKRGNGYFSCHVNGYYSEGGTQRLEFTTHKYTEGFCIVKNFAQDNYSFNVVVDKGRVVELDCDYVECTDGAWDHEADRIGIVEESSITMKTNVTFNITELETFFNSIVSQSYMADGCTVTKKYRIV